MSIVLRLRMFKSKDLSTLEECVKHKIIPVTYVSLKDPDAAKKLLEDYMSRDKNTEMAFAISNQETDAMIGGIDTYLMGDTLLLSYYITPENWRKGYCYESVKLFIEYIRKEHQNIKSIMCLINNSNVASINLAKKLKMKMISKDDFGQTWMLKI